VGLPPCYDAAVDPLARVALHRLRSSRLVGAPLAGPVQVVGWLGAVQAQDLPASIWGVARRTRAATAADVRAAIDDGRILRTHVLRPTWHLVLPADIRWLLALSADRVRRLLAPYDRRLELDARTLRRSHDAIARALEGGHHLSRIELREVLARAGIAASGQRLAHLVMHAELDAVLASGRSSGSQTTYALLDERAPRSRPLARGEALVELARRYVRSHGPAQARDLAWWAGLTVATARAALADAGVASREIEGRTFFGRPAAAPHRAGPLLHLLPNYDEALIAYRDHAVTLETRQAGTLPYRTAVLGGHVVLRDGRAIGGWRVGRARGAVVIELKVPARLTTAERRALDAEVARYGRHLGVAATILGPS
jgi:hypothetical protein